MFEILRIVKKGGYLYAVVPDHPNRTKSNYVLHHRVVMENHLGRLLTENEVVHHLNEDKKDNRIENLEVMTKEEHGRHHGQAGRIQFFNVRIVIRCSCASLIEYMTIKLGTTVPGRATVKQTTP